MDAVKKCCNLALGYVDDSIDTLLNAVKYLAG